MAIFNKMDAKIITLCGKVKYKEEFLEIKKELEKRNHIVFTPTFISAEGITLTNNDKSVLKSIHNSKILLSNEVLIVHDDDIGQDTKEEIQFAIDHNIKVYNASDYIYSYVTVEEMVNDIIQKHEFINSLSQMED